MNTDDLLNKAREATGTASDNALSAALGVTRSAVSNWRRGVAHPDAVTCEKLAVLCGIPLHRVLGIVGEARAISAAEKKVWRKLAAVMFVSIVLVSLPAWAGLTAERTMHYAK